MCSFTVPNPYLAVKRGSHSTNSIYCLHAHTRTTTIFKSSLHCTLSKVIRAKKMTLALHFVCQNSVAPTTLLSLLYLGIPRSYIFPTLIIKNDGLLKCTYLERGFPLKSAISKALQNLMLSGISEISAGEKEKKEEESALWMHRCYTIERMILKSSS